MPAHRADLPPLTYGPVPYVPEVSIFQAPAGVGLWDASGGAYHSDRPPPFWAFPWAGGQALARYVLDHPDVVANRTVLDLGAGSGLVAIAAAYGGAAAVRAVEIDPEAVEAIRRNVAASTRTGAPGLRVDAVLADLLGDPGAGIDADVDVLLAGDVFYTGRMRDRSMRFLRRAERLGIRVLVGDGGRGFLPADRFDLLASYEVPTPVAIEDADRTVATVWELRRSATVDGGRQPMRSVAARRMLPTTPGTGDDPRMTEDGPSGVVFPHSDSTDPVARSTSALGRAVVADALRATDPIGARSAEGETNWRRGYVTHFRRLIEAGLTSPAAGRAIAEVGLAALHSRMRYIGDDGIETGLDGAFETSAGGSAAEDAAGMRTVTVAGQGEVDRELSIPYHGMRLRGADLQRQIDAWTDCGVMEPSAAEALRAVAANPDWLDLADQRIVVLGAGAEMGPVHSLLRWGAGVVAVDLPRPAIWSRLLEINRRYGGSLHLPVRGAGDDSGLAERAGADLLHDVARVARWLGGIDGRLVLGNYVYADGSVNVRVSTAVDVLTARIVAERPDTALAFLATPTDVFAVPGEAVAFSVEAYGRPTPIKRVRQPVRVLSAGRLLKRNYAPGADPGICDSLVAQQGPNYALAKRLQRWRATVARAAGTAVSLKVAPPTRTRSVVKNRALAAAYAGAHLFDVEVFEPATSNTLMAALLVHDLRVPVPAAEYSWQDEAHGAAHGGLWRGPYAPRSALGLAAMIGFGGARG